ncbi:Helix-turn-helix protein [Methylorubrum populi]
MTRSQLRAARALLGWSQERLSEASGVSLPTIKRLEPGEGSLQTRVDTLNKLQAALEAAGVLFIPENGGGAGVRLRNRADGTRDEH